MENSIEKNATEALLKVFENRKSSFLEQIHPIQPQPGTTTDATTSEANTNKALNKFFTHISTSTEKPDTGMAPDTRDYPAKIQALESENKALKEKIKALQVSQLQQTHSTPAADIPLQDIIRRYNEAEKQDKSLGVKEMEVFYHDFMRFLRPYLDKHKELSLPEVIEKISFKDKKKFSTELWTSHQDSIKQLLQEKIDISRQFASLCAPIDSLSQENFDTFAQQVLEARYLNSFTFSSEGMKRLLAVMKHNGTPETSAEA